MTSLGAIGRAREKFVRTAVRRGFEAARPQVRRDADDAADDAVGGAGRRKKTTEREEEKDDDDEEGSRGPRRGHHLAVKRMTTKFNGRRTTASSAFRHTLRWSVFRTALPLGERSRCGACLLELNV